MFNLENLYIAERKSMVDWVAKHYEELSGMYQDPWLRQLMEEVMHSATIGRGPAAVPALSDEARKQLRDRTAEILKGPDCTDKEICLEEIYTSPYFGLKLAETVTDPKEWEKMAKKDAEVFKKHLDGLYAHLLEGVSKKTGTNIIA